MSSSTYPPEFTAKLKRVAELLQGHPDVFLAMVHVIHALAKELHRESGPVWPEAKGTVALLAQQVFSVEDAPISEGYLRASAVLLGLLDEMSETELGFPLSCARAGLPWSVR